MKKPNGDHRLVTAFNSVAAYAKPVPTRSTSSDDILRFLAGFKYIIKTDMTKQFFQMPMTKSSLKYLGVMTPYKGVRVYTKAAMGMPGSTEHLDELSSRVLGHLVRSGKVIRIADDLYAGGDTISDLLCTWEEVLQCMERNNLRLSATKTVICPTSTTILGWHWQQGTISASTHRISPLVSCEKPKTVKGLRSWCGAVKFIKTCIPQCSTLLADLEAATAGKDSKESIPWTESLSDSFCNAQEALKNAETITVPRPSDKLVITTDGCLRPGGIGAVLYVMRHDVAHVGGYFSARLRPHQNKWLPCEVEALAIGSAVDHWAPYLINSDLQVQVLTDSKPCVQAFDRLKKGQFSTSARISSFLSTLSRYNVSLQHIAGAVNLPADYHSRHPAVCSSGSCQVCSFIQDCEDSTVRSINVQDVEQGRAPMPFITPTAWKITQQDCPALRRTYAHLVQGTRPPRKATNVKDVRSYLRSCTVGRDGLLVVRKPVPFARARDLIVVPQHVLHGLLSALHLQLSHPSKLQLKQLFHRYYFALGVDEAITSISDNCAQCAALAKLPPEVEPFSTSEPPSMPGVQFAADVMCRARQKVMVARECFSSYTIARILPDETKDSLRGALLECLAELKAPSGCTVRVDGSTGFAALQDDVYLSKHGVSLIQGRVKNRNKNPSAEKAIQELEMELKRVYPEGGPVTCSQLALCTATLNSRVRNRGLSAREILLQRDDQTGIQLNLSDTLLSCAQKENRLKNHIPSALSQVPKGRHAMPADVQLGDLVFVKSEGTKHVARDKYIVVQMEWDSVYVRKLKGSQFRSKLYKLRYDEIYPVPVPKAMVPVSVFPEVPTDPYCDMSEEDDIGEDQLPKDVVHKPVEDELCQGTSPPALPETVHDAPAVDPIFDLGNTSESAQDNAGCAEPADESQTSQEVLCDKSVQPRRSGRQRKRPARLGDYVCN